MLRLHSIALMTFSLLALASCMAPTTAARNDGADESTDDGADDPSNDDVQDGTCAAWKVSYCAAIKHCGSVTEKNRCQDDVGYVQCLSDAPFTRCQQGLEDVVSKDDCDAWPKDCEPEDIADRTEPGKACKKLHSAQCEWLLYCSAQTSVEGCEANLDASEPCDEFTAVLPNASDCIDAYAKLQCDEMAAKDCATDEILRK